MANKIKKKDLKKPDEFQTISWKIIRYMSENKGKFLLILGILLFFVLSSFGWYFYELNYEKKAQKMYSLALDSYDNKSRVSSNTIDLFEELVKKYPKSSAATNALYSLGNIYFNINEIDESINAYNKYIEKPKECNDLVALAYIGLGYCYEAKGSFTKALESLDNSIEYSMGSSYEGIIYRNMARIYEENNNPQKAIEYYKKALKLTTDPFMEMLVIRKIAILG